MFPYTAQKADELTFYKGSVINVMSKDGEWWKGEMNGQTGMFPSNYVQPLSNLQMGTTQCEYTSDSSRESTPSVLKRKLNEQANVMSLSIATATSNTALSTPTC